MDLWPAKPPVQAPIGPQKSAPWRITASCESLVSVKERKETAGGPRKMLERI